MGGRLPETGPSLRRIIEQEKRRVGRAENSSPFTRSGTSVTAENEVTVVGQMRSADYDGTSRADLGATGWMLGPNDGGPSLLALNGVDVYADLAAKDVTLAAQDVTLAAQDVTLAAQDVTILGLIEDLAAQDVVLAALIASVVTPDSGFATGDTFAIPAGQANRVTRASFTLTVPNGCTSALVQAVGVSGGWNTGGSTDYLYSYLEIGPTPAWTFAMSSTCLNGTVTGSNVFRNVLIEGLSGGDPIVVSIQPYTQVNTWPSSATNSVTVSATCLFMR